MKTCSILKSAALACWGVLSGVACLADTLPGPLVDVAWLAAHRAEVQVVEVREDPASYYEAAEIRTDAKSGHRQLEAVGGHLDGAVLLDFKDIRVEREVDGHKARFMVPLQDDFQARMRQAGLGTLPIVIVPAGQEVADFDVAARLYWTFKYYGQEEMAMLDGGAAAWLLAGQAVSQTRGAAAPGTWSAKEARSGLIAGSVDVVAAQNSATQLIDARTPSQYFGVSKSPAVARFGHLAGAHELAPELLGRSVDGAFRMLPAASYGGILKASGVQLEQPAIAYCNTGHLAAGAWFVMAELMGAPNVRLYDGSLARWTLEGRELVNPAATN